MSKRVSYLRIAEIYLYELRKLEKKRKDDGYNVIDHLTKKGIYYDQALLIEATDYLVNQDLVEVIPDKMMGGLYAKGEPMSSNIKALVKKHRLTIKGRDFVVQKQKLDLEHEKEVKESRKKWVERGITALISIGVSVIVFTLGNYIKEGNIRGKPTVVRDTVVIQYVPPVRKRFVLIYDTPGVRTILSQSQSSTAYPRVPLFVSSAVRAFCCCKMRRRQK